MKFPSCQRTPLKTSALLYKTLATLLLSASGALAVDSTWTSTTSGAWSDISKWQLSTVADGSTGIAKFDKISFSSDIAVHLDSARTMNAIWFGNTSASPNANWVLDNNGNAANVLTLAGTTPTVSVNNLGTGKSATISLQIAGSSGLRKIGTGTLVLTNVSNSFSGQLIAGSASWGTIQIADSTVYGAGNQTITSTIMGTAGASITASSGTLQRFSRSLVRMACRPRSSTRSAGSN